MTPNFFMVEVIVLKEVNKSLKNEFSFPVSFQNYFHGPAA